MEIEGLYGSMMIMRKNGNKLHHIISIWKMQRKNITSMPKDNIDKVLKVRFKDLTFFVIYNRK